jgi:outer membrane lipoprotein SlyB
MKRLVFAVASVAALSLAGCGSNNEDTVQNAEMNQPAAELNDLANDAANDAANAQDAALGNIEAQENAAEDNTVNPTDAQEQNVSGL